MCSHSWREWTSESWGTPRWHPLDLLGVCLFQCVNEPLPVFFAAVFFLYTASLDVVVPLEFTDGGSLALGSESRRSY